MTRHPAAPPAIEDTSNPPSGSTQGDVREDCRPHPPTIVSCRGIALLPEAIYLRYHDAMNRRHRRTLGRVFAEPTPADLRWTEIEALLRAAGAEISEGAGSRARIALSDVRAVFHRPHPSPVTGRGLVRAVRDFLASAGVTPEEE